MSTPRKSILQKCLWLMVATTVPLMEIPANAATYSSVILTDNPVAYYRLEELSGATDAIDSSRNGFHAMYVPNSGDSSPRLGLPGIDTNSISFAGGADFGFVRIPFRQELSPVKADGTHGDAFSVECWAQPAVQPSGGLYASVLGMFGQYGSGTYANSSGWNIAQTPGPNSVWLFNMKNGPFFQAPAQINLLQWYYLAATFDGTNLTFYINGVSQGSQAAPNYLADNGADGQIGVTANAGSPPYTAFTGGVDEVAFYTNVLTAAQILNHYQVGTNSFRATPTPPSISQGPVSTTNFSGTTVTFSVNALGTPPLFFQWLRGTTPITGATNRTLSFTAAYPADDGVTFAVIVSNAVSAVTSAAATLTVTTELNLLGNPVSITRYVGSAAAFRVTVNGALPITYQWYKDDVFGLIDGATNDTLWLSDVQLTDNGSGYYATVSNAFTSADSSKANLEVITRPVVVPITGYAQVVMADDPVAYWRLDEAAGGLTAVDASGSFDGSYNAGAGTLTYGATTGIPRETDGAIGITGGAVVTIPYALELNPITGPWSAEAWVKPATLDPNNFRTVFSSMWNSDFGVHVFGWNVYQHVAGVWTLNIFNGGGSSTFVSDFTHNPLVPDSWYHMVITDDLTTMRFYVNGTLVGSASQASTRFMANTAGPTVLGQRSDNAFAPFDGTIDDVAFYNYALNAQQVQAHYLATVRLAATWSAGRLVLSWPFGTLQQAGDVSGPYAPVTGATSPYTNTLSGAQQFFRVQVQ